MAIQDILVPDIGNFDSVDVIDVLVKVGDTVAKEDSLITVESDKASMDIPSPFAGVVQSVKMKVGDKVAQVHVIIPLEGSAEASGKAVASAPAAAPARRGPRRALRLLDRARAPRRPAGAGRRRRRRERVRSRAQARPPRKPLLPHRDVRAHRGE